MFYITGILFTAILTASPIQQEIVSKAVFDTYDECETKVINVIHQFNMSDLKTDNDVLLMWCVKGDTK